MCWLLKHPSKPSKDGQKYYFVQSDKAPARQGRMGRIRAVDALPFYQHQSFDDAKARSLSKTR